MKEPVVKEPIKVSGEWVEDLDAFAPKIDRYIKFKGKRYGVYSVLDLRLEDALFVLRVETDMVSKELDEQLERARKQLKLLIADISDEELYAMTPKQMIRVAALAMGATGRPQKASGNENGEGSDIPSPSLADSTGGPTDQ